MTESLTIDLNDRSYPILWDSGFDKLKQNVHAALKKSGPPAIITNDTIEPLYREKLDSLFGDAPRLVIPDGESEKRLSTIETLCDKLLAAGFHRNVSLWAFGGGVIGDITGFLASVYMRGADYYQMPTTLLSMVDSSVGGKTGVNLTAGKNMVGSFYQPKSVFIHTGFLETLDPREIKCGLAEIIKSGLIRDKEIITFLDARRDEILKRSQHTFGKLSAKSVQVKASVVSQDEKESGLRAILNFGHTLAHGIESHYEYGKVKHGEAVSIGMSYAAYLSSQLGLLPAEKCEIIDQLLKDLEMPLRWSDLPQPAPSPGEMLAGMRGDKKNIGNAVRFVLLNDIGSCTLPREVDDNTIMSTLESFICR